MKTRLLLLLSLLLAPAVLAADGVRVLVPVGYTGPGVHDSFWFSSALAWNATAREWSSPGVQFLSICDGQTCLLNSLPPGTSGQLTLGLALGFQVPHGYLLYVPEDRLERPALTNMVQWSPFTAPTGIELPTPSEDEFHLPIRLPSVPITGDFQVLLRVYALDLQEPLAVRLFATDVNTSTIVAERSITLEPSSDPMLYPAYAELPLHTTFRDTPTNFLNLLIAPELGQQPNPKVWAFVSVTKSHPTDLRVITPR